MIEGIDKEILDEFIKETMEALDGLDAQFIALERNPEDSDVINSIFRGVHSIKGSSSFFNLNHVRSFAHKLENLLDDLRKGKRSITRDVIDLLLKGKDSLANMFTKLLAGDMSDELLAEDQVILTAVEKLLGEPESGVVDTPAQIFGKIHDLRKALAEDGLLEKPLVAALLLLVTDLRRLTLGEEAMHDGDVPRLGEILVEQGVVSDKDVTAALSSQKKLGEILVEQGKVTPDEIEKATVEQRKKADDSAKDKLSRETEKQAEKKSTAKKTMRIEEEKIDGFMDLVGELIINAEVFNYIQKKLSLGVDIDKIVSEFRNANMEFNELTFKLQRGIGEVRKVSINGIFQKFPRMVRDLALSMGKQVELTLTGDNLLVDKSLYEQLESPLNHIIRNALDHGLETTEGRIAAGKDPVGKLHIGAEETGGDFIITIADDGHGMNADKLRGKAVEKGLISQSAAESMTDKEAYKIIFMPGFSTAQKITDVSGRGVGMDVVMTAIKEVKGKVDIETTLGRGSTFSLIMPMSNTLITISGLLVAVGTERYIIPMEWVKESLRPSKGQISTVKMKSEVVEIRNTLYPLLRLGHFFGVKGNCEHPWDGVVMVIEKEDKKCCFLVDEIIEEAQVVLKDLGKTFRDIKGILGGAILGDGRVGLALDVEGIMQEASLFRER